MPRAVDRNFKHTSAIITDQIKVLMDRKPNLDFVDIESNVPELSGKSEGEIHQAVIDAGYAVER